MTRRATPRCGRRHPAGAGYAANAATTPPSFNEADARRAVVEGVNVRGTDRLTIHSLHRSARLIQAASEMFETLST